MIVTQNHIHILAEIEGNRDFYFGGYLH